MVIADAGGGLEAKKLQAALRITPSNVCKGAGVAGVVVVEAWRICNAGRTALFCTITV